MLNCVPRGLFSWDFDVLGAPDGPAELSFNFFTEQGRIALGRQRYDVEKQGMLSGSWRLLDGSRVVAEAYKPSSLRRRFELTVVGSPLIVEANLPIGRKFNLLQGDVAVGNITPALPIGRRATIECKASVPVIDQLFAFWLVVLTWRRAARSNNAPP